MNRTIASVIVIAILLGTVAMISDQRQKLTRALDQMEARVAMTELARDIYGIQVVTGNLPQTIERQTTPSYGSSVDDYLFVAFSQRWPNIGLRSMPNFWLGPNLMKYTGHGFTLYLIDNPNDGRTILYARHGAALQ